MIGIDEMMDQKTANTIKMFKNWVDTNNKYRSDVFAQAVANWKMNARVMSGPGRTPPAKPALPLMISFDESKAIIREHKFDNGDPVGPEDDPFSYFPPVLAPDFWDLTTKGDTSTPPKGSPLGDEIEAGKKWYAAKDDHSPAGTIWEDAAGHEYTKQARQTPWGPVFTWARTA